MFGRCSWLRGFESDVFINLFPWKKNMCMNEWNQMCRCVHNRPGSWANQCDTQNTVISYSACHWLPMRYYSHIAACLLHENRRFAMFIFRHFCRPNYWMHGISDFLRATESPSIRMNKKCPCVPILCAACGWAIDNGMKWCEIAQNEQCKTSNCWCFRF